MAEKKSFNTVLMARSLSGSFFSSLPLFAAHYDLCLQLAVVDGSLLCSVKTPIATALC